MELIRIIGHQLEAQVARNTWMFLQAMNVRSERPGPQETPVYAGDGLGIVASQLLCRAGLAEEKSTSPDPRIVGWYGITDKGRELVASIDNAEAFDRLGDR